MSLEITAPNQQDRSVRDAIIKGVKCRCPNCGEGKMFRKWLKVTPKCDHCGEELYHERAQDFPPYITITIVGHIVVTLLLIVDGLPDQQLRSLGGRTPLEAAATPTLDRLAREGVVGVADPIAPGPGADRRGRQIAALGVIAGKAEGHGYDGQLVAIRRRLI